MLSDDLTSSYAPTPGEAALDASERVSADAKDRGAHVRRGRCTDNTPRDRFGDRWRRSSLLRRMVPRNTRSGRRPRRPDRGWRDRETAWGERRAYSADLPSPAVAGFAKAGAAASAAKAGDAENAEDLGLEIRGFRFAGHPYRPALSAMARPGIIPAARPIRLAAHRTPSWACWRPAWRGRTVCHCSVSSASSHQRG